MLQWCVAGIADAQDEVLSGPDIFPSANAAA